MANACNIQILEDGPRNVMLKVDIECDTSDLSATTIADPSTLNATAPPTNRLAIDEVQYAIQDGWSVFLAWDATAAKRAVNLDGRGRFPLERLQPITNNAGAGITGKLLVSTAGYTSGTMVATLILYLLKQTV